MFKRLISLLWLIGLVSIAQAQNEPAKWTILYYGNADNDLEGALMEDLYEMQLAGSDENVNLVVQIDRAEEFDISNGDWLGARRYYMEQRPAITPPANQEEQLERLADYYATYYGYAKSETLAELGKFDEATLSIVYQATGIDRLIDQSLLQDLGEVNMGAEETLYDFLVWGIQRYPADRYAVIISTHGGGWQGLGPDYGNPPGMLDLPELSSALKRALATTNVPQFDIVGFDACLMAQLEVMVSIAPYTRYVLAAEEVVPGEGYDYVNALNALKAQPDMDGFELGAVFIDTFMDYYASVGKKQVDLHLIETAPLAELLPALEGFYQASLDDTPSLLGAFTNARINAQVFGSSASDNGAFRASIDLYDFVRLVSQQTTVSEALFNASLEVQARIEQAVVYSRADEFLPNAYGIAIYLPLTQAIYQAGGENYSKQLPAEAIAWTQFLENFHTTAQTVLTENVLSIEVLEIITHSGTASYHDVPIVQLASDGQGIVDMRAFITYIEESGLKVVVEDTPLTLQEILPSGDILQEYPEGQTSMDYAWIPEIPYITDGTTTYIGAIQRSAGSSRFGLYSGQLLRGESVIEANLVFDINTQTLERIVATVETDNGSTLFETPIQPGDLFTPYLSYFTPEGEFVSELADVVFDLNSPSGVSYEYRPAITGDYEVILLLSDLLDNVVIDKAVISVNNDDLDFSLKGDTQLWLGLSYLYPSLWESPSQLQNEDGSYSIYTTANDSDTRLYLSSFVEVTDIDTLFNTAQSHIEGFGGILVGEPQFFEDGDVLGYTFTYSLPTDEGERFGILHATLYVPTSNMYLLDFDGTDVEAVTQAYEVVASSLVYFPPITD